MATTQKTPVWKGTKEIAEQPGYPRIKVDSNGTSITRRYEGAFEKIQAEITSARIATGKAMPNLGAGYSSVRIRTFESWPAEGDSGVLIVQMDDYSTSTGGEDDDVDNSTLEIDWVQLEKSITEHPYYADITDSQWEQIKDAVNDKDAPKEWEDGSKAEGAYNRLKRGVEGYLVFAPVVRRTTPLKLAPTTQTAGTREDPPESPSGDWEFLKTADRLVSPGQSSPFDRVEEWTGADAWDPILYPY